MKHDLLKYAASAALGLAACASGAAEPPRWLNDDVVELPLVFPAGDEPESVERLGDDGTWSPVEVAHAADGTVVLKSPLRFIEPAVFRLPTQRRK